MWPFLYLPQEKYKYEKLNYRITNLRRLIQELFTEQFSGVIEILAPHEKGLLLFYQGRIYNDFYEGTEDLQLSREEILSHFLQTRTAERDTIINVIKNDPRLIVALSALESRTPAHRELETSFLDLPKLFETLQRKHFTGTLRFYRVRNNTRLGNLLVRMKKITPEELKEAIRLQLSSESGLRLGDALVQIRAIEPSELENALDRQALTRKGSDIEIALALFSEGEFLGGYTPAEKKLIDQIYSVLAWVNFAEVFMDIIEGILPSEVAIEAILNPQQLQDTNLPAFTPRPAEVETPVTSPGVKPRLATPWQEVTEATFTLKADDLILDRHLLLNQTANPLPPSQPESQEGILDAVPPPAEPEISLAPVQEPPASEETDGSSKLYSLSASLYWEGYEIIKTVLEEQMGFLGRALLASEKQKVFLTGRPLSGTQLRILIQNLIPGIEHLVGPTAMQKIVRMINERLED